MTKNTNASNLPMAELSLDALDVVMGGNSAAPMGLGGSMAAPMPALTIGSHTASTGAQSPTGYNDHFGLHFGAGAASPSESAANTSSHASSQSAQSDSHDSHMPMGLGGSMPSGAPINSSGGSAQSSSAADASHDGHGIPTTTDNHGGANDGHDFGNQQAGQAVASANGHEQELGVNAQSAFQLLDQAAQDAAHSAMPEALADDHQ